MRSQQKLFGKAILCFGLLLFANLCAADEQGQRLREFLKDLTSLSTPFEQTLLSQYGEELDKSRGMLYVQRPGKFHWAYSEPYVQNLISDGDTLWIYDEDLEQVTIRDVASIIEDSPAALLGGDIDIDEHYVLLDAAIDSELDWLELTPRDEESQYAAIRIGFAGDELQKMILFDALGQTTQIEFGQVKRNLELDRDLFQFSPPADVDVIDSRE